MKKLYKAALLAALGLASATAAQAQEMYLGFNDAGANNGAQSYQNEYVIDLGATSAFTVNSTVNVSFSQSIFDSAFAGGLSTVAAGVVGGDFNNGIMYQSATSLPSAKSGAVVDNSISFANGFGTGEESMSTGNSANYGWSYSVAQSPATAAEFNSANVNPSGDDVAQNTGNPEQGLNSGILSYNLYSVDDTQITGNPWTLLGSININANDGLDTFQFTGADVSPVPEPGMYTLVAGAGLLLVGMRRRFVSKTP